MLALVDCNNFYVSCERVFRPEWKRRPVVVLSNNDGCVVARSQEVKDLGVPMGSPYFKYAQFFKNHDVIVCSSNYTLYADMSQRVMSILDRFSPEIEIYSIDEAFVTLDDKRSFIEQALEMRKTILKWTGIAVSIGIAKTKTLAKAANYFAKRTSKNSGVFELSKKNLIDHSLNKLPVNEVWGIGSRSKTKLGAVGIFSAKELRDADPNHLKKVLSINAVRTSKELQELICYQLNEYPEPKKSIACSRAFGKPISTLFELEEAVATYASRAAEKLREENLAASHLTVFVMRYPFKQFHHQAFSVSVLIPEPTAYTPHLISLSKGALKALYHKSFLYRKAGVIFDGLVSKEKIQQDFFTPQKTSYLKQDKLMQTLDTLNQRYADKVHFAAQGIERPWQMQRKKKSSHTTTLWPDILKIEI